MKVNSFNQNVHLLEIARRDHVQSSQTNDAKVKSFKETFSREMADVRKINFSKHARQRLFSRGIRLSDDKLTQLSGAVDKAAQKGSRETLILDNDAAYVVSIPNRTVISAFDRATLQEGVFTSIDSAVIL
jgi:flagellar operon protein